MSATSIITVNYNQNEVTLDLLKSISKYTQHEDVEVILIDNGSKRDNGAMFKGAYPDLVYINSKENLGFAGGNNLGIKVARGEFLLFLNNDTEVSANYLSVLVNEFKKNPDIGILSPLIVYDDDKTRVQYAGSSNINFLTGRNKRNQTKVQNDLFYSETSHETGYAHGAAMMCRKKDLIRTGLMSENYFLYYEELDWCEKFRKAGKKIWFTGRAKIYHKESVSVGKESSLKTYFMHRNRMLFIRKNSSFITTLIFSAYYILLASPMAILRCYMAERKDLIPWVIKAIKWNLTNSTDSNVLGYKIEQ